jgi:hypothetical protein
MKRILIGAVLALLIAVGLAAIAYKAGRDGANAKHAAMAALITEAADAIEQRTATRIAAIKVVRQTINGQVIEVIRESTVYRECVVDPDMRRLLDAARNGEALPGANGGGLPTTGAGAAP